MGFERVFVPPCPGDEGIAVGCAAFGWHHRHHLLRSLPASKERKATTATSSGDIDTARSAATKSGGSGGRRSSGSRVSVGSGAAKLTTPAAGQADNTDCMKTLEQSTCDDALVAPFWGSGWTEDAVEDELGEWEPWIEVRPLRGVEVGL